MVLLFKPCINPKDYGENRFTKILYRIENSCEKTDELCERNRVVLCVSSYYYAQNINFVFCWTETESIT